MGRRRQSREPGILEMVLDIAWASPLAGVVVSIVLLVIASVMNAAFSSAPMPMGLVGPLMALMFALVALGGLLVSGIAFLRNLFLGR